MSAACAICGVPTALRLGWPGPFGERPPAIGWASLPVCAFDGPCAAAAIARAIVKARWPWPVALAPEMAALVRRELASRGGHEGFIREAGHGGPEQAGARGDARPLAGA